MDNTGVPVTVWSSWFRPGPAGPERPACRAFEPIEKGGIADRPADPFRLAQARHPVLALFAGVVKCTVTGTPNLFIGMEINAQRTRRQANFAGVSHRRGE